MQWLYTAVWELGSLDTKTNFRLKLESKQDALSFSLVPDLPFRNGFRDDMDYKDKGKMSRDADGWADQKKEQDRFLKKLIREQMICVSDLLVCAWIYDGIILKADISKRVLSVLRLKWNPEMVYRVFFF